MPWVVENSCCVTLISASLLCLIMKESKPWQFFREKNAWNAVGFL